MKEYIGRVSDFQFVENYMYSGASIFWLLLWFRLSDSLTIDELYGFD